MSDLANPHPNDPRKRQRSQELSALLARCPEHLFSTDDKELAPIVGEEATPDIEKVELDKAA